LIFIGLICREIYLKIGNFNYRIRLFKEENDFRIQIMEKNRNSGQVLEKKEEDDMFSQIKKRKNNDLVDNKSVVLKNL
jgi:hypothetical protein